MHRLHVEIILGSGRSVRLEQNCADEAAAEALLDSTVLTLAGDGIGHITGFTRRQAWIDKSGISTVVADIFGLG